MIAIKNLTVKFDERTVLQDFSYEFPHRGIVTLTGESGAGKTTLLRIISGLERNFNGELILPPNFSVSYAFQEYRLFPRLSALENVTAIIEGRPADEARREGLSMLKRLGLSEADARLRPSALSGGMKQRVSLARAFLCRADALLLDEPTKELDAAHAEAVLELIREQSRERLVIVVTHRESDLDALAEYIVGKIVV